MTLTGSFSIIQRFVLARKVCLAVVGTVFFAQTILSFSGQALAFGLADLPSPGTAVGLTLRTEPARLRGIRLDPADPLQMDFILDPGDASAVSAVSTDARRLVKYFLAALTIPEKDMWVNLSPYEKDRVIEASFGHTEMGRDLLAQDYLLKQVTASLMHPQGATGKQFWDAVYKEAGDRFGTTDIPLDVLNKVWIVPEKAVVYEHGGAAYIVEARLKVMLDADYTGMGREREAPLDDVAQMMRRIQREIIIPVLEKEVNEGRNFVPLRQVFHAFILGAWFKRRAAQGALPGYVDQQKTPGVEVKDPSENGKIYTRYVEAFRKGVFSFIREEPVSPSGEIVPQRLFSGGVIFGQGIDAAMHMTSDERVLQGMPSANSLVLRVKAEDAAMDFSEAVTVRQQASRQLLKDIFGLEKGRGSDQTDKTDASLMTALGQFVERSGLKKEFQAMISWEELARTPYTDVRAMILDAVLQAYERRVARDGKITLKSLLKDMNNILTFIRTSETSGITVKRLSAVMMTGVQAGAIDPELLLTQFEHVDITVREAMVDVFGKLYEHMTGEDRDRFLDAVETLFVRTKVAGVRVAFIRMLSALYARMEVDGRSTRADLEARMAGASYSGEKFVVQDALGLVYERHYRQGLLSIAALREMSADPRGLFYAPALQALSQISAEDQQAGAVDTGPQMAALGRGELLVEDLEKYLVWHRHDLVFNEEFLDRFIRSSDIQKTMIEIRREARRAMSDGFPYDSPRGRWLAYFHAREAGISNMSFDEFNERVDMLVLFDVQHPGYWKSLFTKQEGWPELRVSVKQSVVLEGAQVQKELFDRHAQELLRMSERVDHFLWVEDFIGHKRFNVRNVYYQFKWRQAKRQGGGDGRFWIDFPPEEDMRRELFAGMTDYYAVLFQMAVDHVISAPVKERRNYLLLLRDLSIAAALKDGELAAALQDDDLATQIGAIRNLYEEETGYLAGMIDFKVKEIKGLSQLFNEMSSEVYAEIAKVRAVAIPDENTYSLVPQGFLSVFRGRSGITECTFKVEPKYAFTFTRAMHEDTAFYFVYHGRELKGYVGLMKARAPGGKRVLAIDTIQSPSLGNEELLTNLFGALEVLAAQLGMDGIVMPVFLRESYNYPAVRNTIAEMGWYKRSVEWFRWRKRFFIAPEHKKSWRMFTRIFGVDKHDSMRRSWLTMHGKFIYVDLPQAVPPEVSQPVEGTTGGIDLGAGSLDIQGADVSRGPGSLAAGVSFSGLSPRILGAYPLGSLSAFMGSAQGQ